MIYGYFSTPVAFLDKKEWLEDTDKICKPYIKRAKTKLKKEIKNTFGLSYHSTTLLGDPKFKDLHDNIGKLSVKYLEEIGHDLTDYSILIAESWVQEFSEFGGGHHSAHVHSNNHVSGFYFLEVSENSSAPCFFDPRSSRVITALPEKNRSDISFVNEKIHYKPKAGDLVIFPAYLMHEFAVQNNSKFRFIHFNCMALKNEFFRSKDEFQKK